MLNKPLLLIGLAGAGKSVVGRLVAAQLETRFIDLDNEVEQEAGMTIGMIFDKLGQSRFRDMESKALFDALSMYPPAVIATGGGTFVKLSNRDHACAHGYVVWLQVSPEQAAIRCARSTERPLLRAGEPTEVLRAHLVERRDAYMVASRTIDTDGLSTDAVASAVVEGLRQDGVI